MTILTRREFVALAAAATPLPAIGQPRAGATTAQEIVDRVRQQLGVPWKAETVDAFKAGDPATPVTGIATTALATMGVLERAVQAGANLIVSCEPTFYGRADTPNPAPRPPNAPGPAGPVRDGVMAAKDDFITKHGLVIWRFSDHWRLRQPNPFARGLRDALDWSDAAAAGAPDRVTIPATSLDALATRIGKGLGVRGGLRVVGDPRSRVRRIGLLPGSTPIQASVRMLPGVDAIVAGEVREWETVEYVRDAVTAGGRKGLILVGRIVSEEPGMRALAAWLKSIVPGVAVAAIAAGDPYWRPR